MGVQGVLAPVRRRRRVRGGAVAQDEFQAERAGDVQHGAELHARPFAALDLAHPLARDARPPGQLGLREDRKTPLFNGAIECRLFEFSMRQRG